MREKRRHSRREFCSLQECALACIALNGLGLLVNLELRLCDTLIVLIRSLSPRSCFCALYRGQIRSGRSRQSSWLRSAKSWSKSRLSDKVENMPAALTDPLCKVLRRWEHLRCLHPFCVFKTIRELSECRYLEGRQRFSKSRSCVPKGGVKRKDGREGLESCTNYFLLIMEYGYVSFALE
jgi:hypothetical protein